MELDFEPVEERKQGWAEEGGHYCLTCGYRYGITAPTRGLGQHQSTNCIKFLRDEIASIKQEIDWLRGLINGIDHDPQLLLGFSPCRSTDRTRGFYPHNGDSNSSEGII